MTLPLGAAWNGNERTEDGLQGRNRVFDPLTDVRGLDREKRKPGFLLAQRRWWVENPPNWNGRRACTITT